MGISFEQIGIDMVGPLKKSATGHKYILVILDYTTRQPEAFPLQSATAAAVASKLIKIFARMGIPKEILMDQGTNFTSQLMKELCDLLKVKSLRTSVYHPQTDGLVE